jgi:hypothetical protein
MHMFIWLFIHICVDNYIYMDTYSYIYIHILIPVVKSGLTKFNISLSPILLDAKPSVSTDLFSQKASARLHASPNLY